MESYVLRLWLPDRPGALGAVASRIGAVKGDVVGIEILEVGEGQAVDELVVRLPEASLLDLLVAEVRQVDGVEVEEVRPCVRAGHDPRLAVLEITAKMVEATSRDALLGVAVGDAPPSLTAAWLAVLDGDTGSVLARGDEAPTAGWLSAFAHGASSALSLGGMDAGPSDVISSTGSGLPLVLVAGRERVAWRDLERQQLEALARVVAARWNELHPAVAGATS